MRDGVALVLLAALSLVAATGYRFRVELQPSRAAAVGFLAGALLWGVALFGLWYTWSQVRPACASTCDEYTAVIGEDIENLSVEP